MRFKTSRKWAADKVDKHRENQDSDDELTDRSYTGEYLSNFLFKQSTKRRIEIVLTFEWAFEIIVLNKHELSQEPKSGSFNLLRSISRKDVSA